MYTIIILSTSTGEYRKRQGTVFDNRMGKEVKLIKNIFIGRRISYPFGDSCGLPLVALTPNGGGWPRRRIVLTVGAVFGDEGEFLLPSNPHPLDNCFITTVYDLRPNADVRVMRKLEALLVGKTLQEARKIVPRYIRLKDLMGIHPLLTTSHR